ncbi:hypothetical protein DUNSADRAFT_9179 [Dunaliella salina]|uniref:Uncharacterized protein n=1 Tax=Dunaliella salina TaxID=3046 RepID=A0ABQ7FSH0_DUNSA|nr:hypothetical protein DUNSADRAFT_9179 [Dunaliella salina]|eukprot:KAF5825501.1 hypothetical protein DUNSADRAFT_9179 [Dunaliella salina]
MASMQVATKSYIRPLRLRGEMWSQLLSQRKWTKWQTSTRTQKACNSLLPSNFFADDIYELKLQRGPSLDIQPIQLVWQHVPICFWRP